MFGDILKKKPTALDGLIAKVLSDMDGADAGTEEYSKLLSELERLYKLKTKERQQPVSRDTIALIAGNLAGILLIVAYEQKHVMTSKGFGQLIHPK